MSRLPTPGADNGTWGNVLNDFLSQSHSSDGTLKAGSVGASQVQDGALPKTKLDTTAQASLTKADNSLQASNNLSDVTATTARTNLGLGTAATMTPAQIAGDSALTATYAAKKLLPLAGVGGSSRVVTILTYHTVPVLASFQGDLDKYQAWNYKTVTFDDLHAFMAGTGTLPDKPLLITFDDGYATQYTTAYPELVTRGMKATIFAATDFIDGAISLNYNGESTAWTWGNAATMKASGLIDIQSHTKTHTDLMTLSAAQVAQEFSLSKARIEAQVPGQTVSHLAYPYGSWSKTVRDALEAEGCQTARVVRINAIDGGNQGANLGRYAFALLGLHDSLALPTAGTGYADIQQPNLSRRVTFGENLVPDEGFEAGGKGWSLGTGWTIVTSDKHSGTKCLQGAQQASTTSSYSTDLIPIGPYSKLAGSVWIKTSGLTGSTHTKLQLQFVRGDGTTSLGVTDMADITGNNGAWTQYSFVYNGDQNQGFVRFYAWLAGDVSSGVALFDDLKVYRDTEPTPLALQF